MERFRGVDYQGTPAERSALSRMTGMLGYGTDPATADSVFRRVAELERQESGSRGERYAAVLVQWSRARARQEDVEAADSLQAEAVRIYRARGAPTLALANALIQQASYARLLGDPGRTLALAEESVRIQESILGADHVDIAPARTSLAEAQGRMGLHDEAVASMERVVATYEAAGDSIFVGPGRWRLAVQLQAAGRIDAADRLYRGALDAFRAAFPDDYLLTANVRLDYGAMLATQGRPDEAEPMLRLALPVLVNRWGEESLRADMARVPLAVALLEQARLEEARALLEPVVERLRAEPGPEHPLTRQAEETLDRIQGLP
jgi:tetratricopeptide (TPR) repeat protein